MARAIFSVVAGLIVAVVVVWAGNLLSHTIHPPPAGLDLRDAATMRDFVASLPVSAILLVGLGWILGAGFGAFMAVRMARRAARWPGYLVGALILLATMYNLYVIPHPMWFAGVAVVGIAVATVLGVRIGFGSPVAPAGIQVQE
jgi:hypothetical protein